MPVHTALLDGHSDGADTCYACSEPETQLLKSLAEEFEPHVWLNVHSGMEALFMPYDHVATIPTGPAAEATYNILDELNIVSCNSQCAIGSGGESVGEYVFLKRRKRHQTSAKTRTTLKQEV